MANASVEKLWQQAVKAAGAAFVDRPRPELPSLKMTQVGFALMHFLELLDGQVPDDERAHWAAALSQARQALLTGSEPKRGRVFARIESTATWPNLAHALHQAALRASFAPGLATVAQRAVVSIAISLLRRSSGDRAAATARIDEGISRLVAGLWLADARARLGERATHLELGWWAAPNLALFSTKEGPWWLVTLAPRRAPRISAGERDELLATIPDAHFAQCVACVMREVSHLARPG
jgi:hypothetical protein